MIKAIITNNNRPILTPISNQSLLELVEVLQLELELHEWQPAGQAKQALIALR